MLFNSFLFIFIFLPLTVSGFFLIAGRIGRKQAVGWLVTASLIYYGYWNPVYLFLISGSIAVNFSLGRLLARGIPHKRNWLILGVVLNLGSIGYFKYANFFVDNINALTGSGFDPGPIVLPLAISFFTFQQIAFLVDAYRGYTREYDFVNYCLFVTFFPQLIAGPIVHHSEMMPQFVKQGVFRLNFDHLALGMSTFIVGLFKKVFLADQIAAYAIPVFAAADQGASLTFFEAWGGALAYTFQLYFDFSGYSDMAIGLAWMFGIRLPLNFNSPYKATNIIEFWRRWHMTLSRFLRDYVYIACGGNRKGEPRRYFNIMTTMLLGGLWHGASWNFVLWGGVHGLYLLINHLYHAVVPSSLRPAGLPGKTIGLLVTFFAVVLGWVLFRAETLPGASALYQGMAGVNGIVLPISAHAALDSFLGLGGLLGDWGLEYGETAYLYGFRQFRDLLLAFIIIWGFRNTYQYTLGAAQPGIRGGARFAWRPSMGHLALISILFAVTFFEIQKNEIVEFLYFDF